MEYRPRWLAGKLREAIEFSPVVVLSGARQTGKSTLLRSEAPFRDWPYLTLDDLDTRETAEKDPGRLAALHDRVVIDEVQKAPGLLAAVKVQVDRDRGRRFVLSGSANLLLMKKATESLAGRCLYFDLMPFSLGEEELKAPTAWMDLAFFESRFEPGSIGGISDFRLLRGALPPVATLKKPSHVADWWQGYTRTYLERDLRDISQVTNLSDFRKTMALLASSSGQILNQANIARALTVKMSVSAWSSHPRSIASIRGLPAAWRAWRPPMSCLANTEGSFSRPWPSRIFLFVPLWREPRSSICGNWEGLSARWIS